MKLETGAKALGFSLKSSSGADISLADFSGQKVVVYFYPKADTPGCTRQTCLLNDSLEELKQLDTQVIGISPDNEDKQKKFADKYNIAFPLLCDEAHAVADLYGVWGEKKMYGKSYMGIIRSAFMIDEKGDIVESWYKISPADTVNKVLKALK